MTISKLPYLLKMIGKIWQVHITKRNITINLQFKNNFHKNELHVQTYHTLNSVVCFWLLFYVLLWLDSSVNLDLTTCPLE